LKSKQSVTKVSGEDIRGDLSPATGRRAESMYVPKRRKAKKNTPSKSPPRSTSRKRSKKHFKNSATEATGTDMDYKTPKQKLKRDD
jgi:hypothetical protein